MNTLNIVVFIISAFVIFKTGDALRCWKCSNDEGGPCADYFNTTKYRAYSSGFYDSPYNNYGNRGDVHLEDCEQSTANFPNSQQRAVCMKKKLTNFGHTTYVRSCRFLHYQEKIGSCPPETTSSQTTIDFCEYCDYDGCNTATSMTTSFLLACVAPLGLLLLRK